MKDKKRDILKIIKKGDEFSTSKIAYIINANYNRAEELLEELKKEKRVVNIQKKSGVFWRLK